MPFAITYSFANFQTSDPSAPLPGAELDTQLANVATEINSLGVQLSDVRRSDGKLANYSVGFDTLDEEVRSKLNGAGTVTTFDLDAGAFASEAEAIGGVATQKIMAPSTTATAINNTRPYASQGEATAGLLNDRVMTPLRTKDALDTQRPYASQAEAQAGSNNTKVMSPLRTAELLAEKRPTFSVTSSLTFGTIADGALTTVNVAVASARAGDHVLIAPVSATPVGVVLQGQVTADDTVAVTAINMSGSEQTLTASSFKVTALRL
ncbi:hypothetical protein IWQ55_000293 [Labrenzia sp. EL_208]|nr:hypothetical protein [Labrenzia sp. EL_132]MBG6227101.1 hypothetical protein [Labrenzia sp. EL_208]